MIVYIAENKINGKVYVGKTVRTLSHAKARHHQRAKFAWKYGTFSRFYTAIRKYGFDSFEWSVAYVGSSDEDIQMHERLFIEKLRSTDKEFGYNMTPGGDGGAGKKLSKSQVEKLRVLFSGNRNPQFGKFGSDHPAFGNRHSAEARAKISNAHKGRVVGQETRRKLSETRRKMFSEQVADRRKRIEADRLERKAERKRRLEAGEFKGENAGASKLTNLDRKEICQRRRAGESYSSIAKSYPVGLTGVRAVCLDWGPLNGFPFEKVVAPRKQKLTDQDKREICNQYGEGATLASLSEKYLVGQTTIHTVLRQWGPQNGYESLRSKKSK